MAEFISNSAIPPRLRAQRCTYSHALERPGVPKMAEFGIKPANVICRPNRPPRQLTQKGTVANECDGFTIGCRRIL